MLPISSFGTNRNDNTKLWKIYHQFQVLKAIKIKTKYVKKYVINFIVLIRIKIQTKNIYTILNFARIRHQIHSIDTNKNTNQKYTISKI